MPGGEKNGRISWGAVAAIGVGLGLLITIFTGVVALYAYPKIRGYALEASFSAQMTQVQADLVIIKDLLRPRIGGR